jgi:hypothetical protein
VPERRWRLRVAKRRVRHFHQLPRRLLHDGGVPSPDAQPARLPGVWTRATRTHEQSCRRQARAKPRQGQQQQQQQRQQQQEVRERLVVVAMGDSGSGRRARCLWVRPSCMSQ